MCDNGCEFSGLHVGNANPTLDYTQKQLTQIGELCLQQIKEVWPNTDWTLVIEND